MNCRTRTTMVVVAVALIALATISRHGWAEPIQKDEIGYQNQAFKQWFGTTLIWRYKRLPLKAIVPKHRLPYAGAIYLDSQGGTSEVLNKYDHAFHDGQSRASSFEHRDIAFRGFESWAGHCNGWTAASIRHAEPQRNVVRNGVTFTPADIKGLLAELYVYAESDFLGGVDSAINPGTFHVIMTNWIGRSGHPIGMDAAVGREVWNYPVYAFTAQAANHSPGLVEIKMNLGYVGFLEREARRAPRKFLHKFFHYMLELNTDGEIVGGHYFADSERVDMLWVPLKPTQGGQQGNEDGNPHLNHQTILQMWRDSVPPSSVQNWYNVDPTPQDAILDDEIEQFDETPIAPRTPDEIAADTGYLPVDGVEVFHEHFDDGTLRVERHVVRDEEQNYVNHGRFRMWDGFGNLRVEGRFDRGQRDGTWARWHQVSESKLFAREDLRAFAEPFFSEAEFAGDKLNGRWVMKDRRGRVVFEIDFADGIREGREVWYYVNGQIARSTAFHHGLHEGVAETFSLRGRPLSREQFRGGRRLDRHTEKWPASPQKKIDMELLRPAMIASGVDEWDQATLVEFQPDTAKPSRHGMTRAWHQNGQKQLEGEFTFDKPTGEFTWWHENGEPSRTGQYEDGKPIGRWWWWYADGTPAMFGNYVGGQAHGRWLWWHTDGRLAHGRDLVEGEPDFGFKAPTDPIAVTANHLRTERTP